MSTLETIHTRCIRGTREALVPDVLPQGLKVVFCGTALGNESFRQRAYYAHPGNLFWRTLHRIGLTPRVLAPQEYPEVVKHGIGLTDVCKTAYGNDDDLRAEDFNAEATHDKIMRASPHFLAFTSVTAGSVFLDRDDLSIGDFGLLPETVGKTKLFLLPSPSGQARRFWREDVWQTLAEKILTA